ncbi:hypothetical protein EES41_27145 [Streptomyces sp. ADI95-16]|uniref:hypothetical protein n=2 Tax=unclassified Streptomyces TaxID=2593676 RepID=UPI000F433B4C|nr:hypothetical protein [Streptomyces sp. ADI95-16]AYV30401.1 hypothetical protein EES41_27145 [Streptomyces sp. ADI95-16]
MGQKATQGIEAFGDASDANNTGKKLDLSVAQVAGTSLATVAAALLASKLGVYGTILGAGVVSVVATAGGPVIQHFFRRTGDQLRETARPRVRQEPLPGKSDGENDGQGDGEFGAATVHGTRVRGWKRTAVASGAAFAIAIGGLGAYEAVAGTSVSKDGGTIFSAGTRKAPDARPDPGTDAPERERQERQGGGERDGKGGATPGSGGSPSPSPSPGDRSPGSGPSPSGSGEPPASPKPSPSTPAPSQDPNPDPGQKPSPDPDPDPKPKQTPAPPGSAPAPAPRSSS